MFRISLFRRHAYFQTVRRMRKGNMRILNIVMFQNVKLIKIRIADTNVDVLAYSIHRKFNIDSDVVTSHIPFRKIILVLSCKNLFFYYLCKSIFQLPIIFLWRHNPCLVLKGLPADWLQIRIHIY